jgi:TetR/AcrR family transcriptional regulator, transcriptional repressor of aconitase
MPKVSPEHVEARRAQILVGARRCFARWGYEGATVPRLEREIGLSHGAIFNYYRSKLDLFVALAVEDHRRFHRLYDELGFAGLARHIAEADPAWLSVYLELHRRLYTDAALAKAWRKAARGDEPAHVHTPEERLAHTLLDGLVFERAAGLEIDVEPIIALAAKALGQ